MISANNTKMSALGEMAAGIAHEINNPLAAILSRAGLLIEMAEEDRLNPETIKTAASAIEATGLRISRTVRALRAFARGGEGDEVEPYALDTIFGDTLELCQERFRHERIELRVFRPEPALMVECQHVTITQVLVNLLNNAFDATARLDLNDRWVELTYFIGSTTCEISVRNGGPRIPDHIRDQIMQPFFTTKPAGKGTGLGLSVSQRILHAHSSSLELDPSSPQTRFFFELKLA